MFWNRYSVSLCQFQSRINISTKKYCIKKLSCFVSIFWTSSFAISGLLLSCFRFSNWTVYLQHVVRFVFCLLLYTCHLMIKFILEKHFCGKSITYLPITIQFQHLLNLKKKIKNFVWFVFSWIATFASVN